MKLKQKVLAYITRKSRGGVELLVFEHVGIPEAGVQVPAGTIENEEVPIEALKRELREESGIEVHEVPRFLGQFRYFRADRDEQQLRYVFHILKSDLPDHWDHKVTGKGEDEDLIFRYFWINVSEAALKLAGNLGNYISHI